MKKPTHPAVCRTFYSGYKKQVTLKYEVAISELSGFIVWINSPFSGPTHDLIIFCFGLMGKMDMLSQVVALADGAYVGEQDYLVTPPRPYKHLNPIQKAYYQSLSRRRILIENFFARLKGFAAFSNKWRHSKEKHVMCFHVLTQILNVEFLSLPLRAN